MLVEYTHDELVLRAERWLKQIGCGVVFRELVTSTYSGEQPDAIGWRSTVSVLIECKANRADFLADKKKPFRRRPEDGMGDWRIYMCPPEVIQPEDLPNGWGLLWVCGRTVKRVHGIPKGNVRWLAPPLQGNKTNEAIMMYSALRRLTLRGHIESIYERLNSTPPDPDSVEKTTTRSERGTK